MQISLNFRTSCSNLKIGGMGKNHLRLFSTYNFFFFFFFFLKKKKKTLLNTTHDRGL